MKFSEFLGFTLFATFFIWIVLSGWAVSNGCELSPLNFWYYVKILIEIAKEVKQ